jgi:hypothetical protein
MIFVLMKEEMLEFCLVDNRSANFDSLLLRYHLTLSAFIASTGCAGILSERINVKIYDQMVKLLELHCHEESISIIYV